MDLQQMNTKEIAQMVRQAAEDTWPQLLEALEQDGRRSVQTMAQRLRRQIKRQAEERQRVAALWRYERQARAQGYRWIAGTDEVGRGPLAGPVVAAAVILPEDAALPGIKDSKKLTERQREQLAVLIKEQAVAWAIAAVSEKEIDAVNILEASRLAMRDAVEQLSKTQAADFVLVDGLPNPQIALPSQAIVKGDNQSISIAAAAIIAKVYRDHLMDEYEKQYPGYGFGVNKGYPTAEHLRAVAERGPCAIHRMSFRPLCQSAAGQTGGAGDESAVLGTGIKR